MKKCVISISILIFMTNTFAQKPEDLEDWSRKPPVVIPGNNNLPPSDAVILYSGPGDAVKWISADGKPFVWKTEEILTVAKGSGDIRTVQAFGDCQLHVEWRTPTDISGSGQDRGNSGIFLMEKYEVQVLDSYENETYYNGMAGSVYKQYIPLVNASTPPGTWQTYDIFFTAPRFNTDKTLIRPAFITVVHNGVLIQNHVMIKGPSDYERIPSYTAHPEKLPLRLQEHGHAVSYRNIWIREL